MGVFEKVGGAQPGRSVFDLSYSKLFTCDMGQLIPVFHDEVYPGDLFKIAAELVVRMQPLVSPVMHEIYGRIHYFFVPNRLLWEDWEDFITGGVDGEDASVLPRWNPTSTVVGSLWDYFGLPIGVTPTGALPVDFIRRAYNLIWNEYYRDQNVMDELDISVAEEVQNCCWKKDYFASALPWQQRGTALSLPISGTSNADFTDSTNWVNSDSSVALKYSSGVSYNHYVANAQGIINAKNALSQNVVDLSAATTFDVADLRLVFQIQKWMERNARCGARYTEQLKAHFSVSNGDDRLQRPEYIGGVKYPIITSEVLQTSSTDATSPQGNLAGHGIGAGQDMVGSYRATEHGWIIGIMSILPVPVYQQGIDRQLLRRSKYDYYFPEFANLSEQAIERAEIFASAVEAENRTIFGYQGRYDELRNRRNLVCGLMRTDFDYWHLARQFSAAPELNSAFLLMDAVTGGASNTYKRIFAVPSEPGFVVTVGNLVQAVRPMPIQSEPGLIDHG